MHATPASRAERPDALLQLRSTPNTPREGSAARDFSTMLEDSARPRTEQRATPDTTVPRHADARSRDGAPPERERAPANETQPQPRDGRTEQGGRPDTAPAANAKDHDAPDDGHEGEETEELPAGFAALTALLAAPEERAGGRLAAHASGQGALGAHDDARSARHTLNAPLLATVLASAGEGEGRVAPTPLALAPALSAATADAAHLLPPGGQAAGDGEQPAFTLAHATATAARSEAGALAQHQVNTPVTQRGWAEDVGNRMLWMIGRNESKAELMLTPPSLGKVGVSIVVNGDQTSAHFVAATQAAREALEHALPRLREALQQAGIQLGQTDVSTAHEQQHHGSGDDASRNARGAGAGTAFHEAGDSPLADASDSQQWTRVPAGRIDLFA